MNNFITITTGGQGSPVAIDRKQTPFPVNSELLGLDLEELDQQIHERRTANPVYLNSILDGISLFRNLSLSPSECVDCHYALLLKGRAIVGIVRLNMEGETDSMFEGDYLPADALNVRYLMTYILETGATSVLLLSSRHTTTNTFNSDDLAFISRLTSTFSLVDVALLDWVVLISTENTSWRWQCFQGSITFNGMTNWQFADFGTPYAETSTN